MLAARTSHHAHTTGPAWRFSDLNVPLTLAAVAAVALWLLAVVAVKAATRPRMPHAGPKTMDLRPESPAVAEFLTGGWEVGGSAVQATLVDLAGRGLLGFEQVGPDARDTIVRVTGEDGRHIPARGNPGPLLPFEKRVLHRVTALANGGVVPARALAQGTKDQDAKWHKAFDREVVADARARGLSRPRYGFGIRALLVLAALVPATLAAVAAAKSRSNGDGDGGLFAVLLLGALFVVGTLTGERETEAGQAACAEWLGMRDWLAADEQFRRLPPAAVAIWDRYLAFAAGFGIARKTVGALPLGARDEGRAWSTYGGVWHEVRLGYLTATERRVRHPKQSVRIALRRIAACLVLAPGMVWVAVHKHWMVDLPLGHGTDGKVFTALAIAIGCVIVSVSLYNVGNRPSKGQVVGIAFYILAPGALLWYVSHSLSLTGFEVSHTYVSYAVIAVSTLLLLVTGWNLVLLFGALADLALREQIVGEVVRIRDRSDDRHIAVDPGGVAKVHAWPVARNAFGSLEEGASVCVERGRWFGYVYDVSVTTASARGNLFAEAV
ncbi:MAG: DUF2207 domain-containing protein [Catenulispora sp.]|nr:DUF2207 domain-containing protein [Catenulispora sp.]